MAWCADYQREIFAILGRSNTGCRSSVLRLDLERLDFRSKTGKCPRISWEDFPRIELNHPGDAGTIAGAALRTGGPESTERQCLWRVRFPSFARRPVIL